MQELLTIKVNFLPKSIHGVMAALFKDAVVFRNGRMLRAERLKTASNHEQQKRMPIKTMLSDPAALRTNPQLEKSAKRKKHVSQSPCLPRTATPLPFDLTRITDINPENYAQKILNQTTADRQLPQPTRQMFKTSTLFF